MTELKCCHNNLDVACAAKAGLDAGAISKGMSLAALAEAVDALCDDEGHTDIIPEIHTDLIITKQSYSITVIGNGIQQTLGMICRFLLL